MPSACCAQKRPKTRPFFQCKDFAVTEITHSAQKNTTTCDIFCRVIDNFGDAGIAWRLARTLIVERAWQVRLIIDDTATLSAFVPAVNIDCDTQSVAGITVQKWSEAWIATRFGASDAADVVIEMFSCYLPETYEAAIDEAVHGTNPRKVAVLALDYLTAERYAEEANGLASPHPRYGYPKTFLFPGFTDKTCGFVREAGLLEDIKAFEADPRYRAQTLRAVGADTNHPFTLYFFTYPTTPVRELAQALARDVRPIQIVAAPGKAGDMLEEALTELGHPAHIRLVRHAMTDQLGFDRLLWACDACLVRGEDSTMRAQLSGRPLIWSLYPQSEDTHLVKLAAFEALYCSGMPENPRSLWHRLHAWINGAGPDPQVWHLWRDAMPEMRRHALLWRAHLFAATSLTERLTKVAEKQLK